MDVAFDPAKDAGKLAKHGVSLASFAGCDAEPVTMVDDRHDYGEVRFRAVGRSGGVPHAIAYTNTATGIRLIRFRRAHEQEMRRHA